jgi:hypothetical protein
VLLVEHDAITRGIAVVGLGDKFATNGDLRRKADDSDADLIEHQIVDCAMDVTRVGGMEGAEDKKNFSGAMTRSVEECCSGHLEGILQARVTLWILFAHVLDCVDMVGWVPTHVADSDGNAISHAYQTELRYWILFEELMYEGCSIQQHENISCWPQVFLIHSQRHIQYQDQVAYDTSLKGSGVFQQPNDTSAFSCRGHGL